MYGVEMHGRCMQAIIYSLKSAEKKNSIENFA